MKEKTKKFNNRKILMILTVLMFSLSILLFTSVVSYAWLTDTWSKQEHTSLGNVSLGNDTFVIKPTAKVAPGAVLVEAGKTIDYVGVPAYYKMDISIEFYDAYNSSNSTYTGPNADKTIKFPTKYDALVGSGKIQINNGEAIVLNTSLDNNLQNKHIKVVIDVNVIQQAGLPNGINNAKAAFDWYTPVLNFNDLSVPNTPVTIKTENGEKNIKVQKELGKGGNSGRFRLTTQDNVVSNSNNAGVRASDSNKEFYFFADRKHKISDANIMNLDFSSIKVYTFDVWYDLPHDKLDLEPIYLTPNIGMDAVVINDPSNKKNRDFYDILSSAGESKVLIVSNKVYGIQRESSYNDPNNTTLETIILPCTLRKIGEYAFENCANLKNVIIQDGVKLIGHSAFYHCANLKKINLPSSIQKLESNAFDTTGLTSIILPKDLEQIYLCFDNCKDLSSVGFEHGCITKNIRGSFRNCPNLTTFTVPDGLEKIECTFSDNPNLLNIYANESCANFSSVDGILYNKEKNRLYRVPIGKNLSSFEVPDGVRRIDAAAFNNCKLLEEIKIPNSVYSVGGSVFNGTKWYDNQTDGFLYISNILIGYKGNQETMPTTLDVAYGTRVVAENSFSYNSKINIVTFPETLTSVCQNAFAQCNLVKEVNIPKNLVNFSIRAFFWAHGILNYNVAPENPNYTSVDGVLYNKDKTTLITYPAGREGAFEIPKGVTRIEKCAFEQATKLTAITIPEGVKIIGAGAFYMCPIPSVVVPNSVEVIETFAFAYCEKLTSVILGSGIKELGHQVFWALDVLPVIYCGAENQTAAWNPDWTGPHISPSVYFKDQWHYCPQMNNNPELTTIKYLTVQGNANLIKKQFVCSKCGEIIKEEILNISNSNDFLIEYGKEGTFVKGSSDGTENLTNQDLSVSHITPLTLYANNLNKKFTSSSLKITYNGEGTCLIDYYTTVNTWHIYYAYLRLLVNGKEMTRQGDSPTSSRKSVIKLNKGDSLEIQFINNDDLTNTQCEFSITGIGILK